jgi:hypothetical protein
MQFLKQQYRSQQKTTGVEKLKQCQLYEESAVSFRTDIFGTVTSVHYAAASDI